MSDPVIEWEISAHKTENGMVVVAQVVLKSEYKGRKAEAIEFLCKKYHLDSVKIYDSFETSDVTGKRDFQKLKNDKNGYYAPYDDFCLAEISYLNGQRIVKKITERL